MQFDFEALRKEGVKIALQEFRGDCGRQPDPMELQAIRYGVTCCICAMQEAIIADLRKQLEAVENENPPAACAANVA